jgi:hypothetical protein
VALADQGATSDPRQESRFVPFRHDRLRLGLIERLDARKPA